MGSSWINKVKYFLKFNLQHSYRSRRKKKILGLLAQLLGKWQVLGRGAGTFCLLQEPGWSSWQHKYPFLDLQEISLLTLMAISRHAFICRRPKILGWRCRVHGTALHPIATGFVFLTCHLLAFSRQPQAEKPLPLAPCLWQQGKAEPAAKQRKHTSITSKTPGWTKVERESFKSLLRTALGAAVAAFTPGETLLGRSTAW